MKVAIGLAPRPGPWGGGSKFAAALAEALGRRGEAVRFDLGEADLDLILLTDPRARAPGVAFGPGAIWRYLIGRNPNALVVHRINECDERKGTHRMNAALKRANLVADHTVFIASWLRGLNLWRGEGEASVILNGADPSVFHPGSAPAWQPGQPLRLVTHHWGGHAMKGFDVYHAIDRMLASQDWRGRLEFTYVGNLPGGLRFENARYVEPLDGPALADELRGHHAYVTASINEPAGMHHIEGAMCGLPLLYRRSGALPEYCDGFGEGFDGPQDFVPALDRMTAAYAEHRSRLAAYPHTAERMCEGYLALFADLLARREALLARRDLWRDPGAILRNQLAV